MNMDDFLRTGLHAEAASDTPAFLNFSHTIFIIKTASFLQASMQEEQLIQPYVQLWQRSPPSHAT